MATSCCPFSFSFFKRTPFPGAPIQRLEGGEGFFIVVVAGLDCSITRVKVTAATVLRVGNFMEESANTQTARRRSRLEHRIDARAGFVAEVEIADG